MSKYQSGNDQLAAACGGMSDSIDELYSYSSILNARTHNRAEVEKNADEIEKIINKIEESLQGTKKYFAEYRRAVKSG